jgi:hypothetical protein
MQALWLMLYSVTAGFTASAITANLYRIAGIKAESTGSKVFRSAVLILAGPSVLFESAMRGFIGRTWHPVSFWLAATVVLYWSLGLGLLLLQVATHM